MYRMLNLIEKRTYKVTYVQFNGTFLGNTAKVNKQSNSLQGLLTSVGLGRDLPQSLQSSESRLPYRLPYHRFERNQYLSVSDSILIYQ
jgi:hypothetical protein